MKTRPLDQFPPQYHRILQKVRDEGRVYLTFASTKEANTIKMDFYRYRDSIITNTPDSWEADLVKGIMIRKKDAALEFSVKARWGAMLDIDTQLESTVPGTTDEEAETLRRLDEDIKAGRY